MLNDEEQKEKDKKNPSENYEGVDGGIEMQ